MSAATLFAIVLIRAKALKVSCRQLFLLPEAVSRERHNPQQIAWRGKHSILELCLTLFELLIFSSRDI